MQPEAPLTQHSVEAQIPGILVSSVSAGDVLGLYSAHVHADWFLCALVDAVLPSVEALRECVPEAVPGRSWHA